MDRLLKIPVVGKEIWKDLYEAALQFEEKAPWELLDDDQLFGAKDPLTGEIGYCCILGALGEVFGLCVYRGSEGWDLYQKCQNEEIDPEQDDFFALNNALMAEFADRRDLEKEDLRVIKDLGYKFRGSKAYPLFRSYLPGYAPWFLNESEAIFLTFALRCAVDFYLLYDENPVAVEPTQQGSYLVYMPEDTGGETSSFQRQWLKPEPHTKPEAPQIPIDKVRVRRIKEKAQFSGNIWEVDFFFMSGARVLDGERPYFPRLITVADQSSLLILFVEVINLKVSPYAALQEGLLAAIEKHRIYPQEIRVKDEISWDVLKPLADSLGIRLRLDKNLPAIMEFKMAIARDWRQKKF